MWGMDSGTIVEAGDQGESDCSVQVGGMEGPTRVTVEVGGVVNSGCFEGGVAKICCLMGCRGKGKKSQG